MSMTLRRMAVMAVVAVWSCGCPRHALAEPETPAGVVFIVEGVGGGDILAPVAQWALPHAGVPHEIRNFVWTHGRGQLFKDLQDFRYLKKKAEELADEVRAYKEEHPDRPVYLIGKSGGTGVVLAAAGLLPAKTLDRIILLSAAVSPHYDLCSALRATRGEIVSFHSVHDNFILDWGTRQFGTIDRWYSSAAGLRGFAMPEDLSPEDRALYDRLVQVAWRPDMILQGHFGNHLGTSMPGFVIKEVAPWLKP